MLRFFISAHRFPLRPTAAVSAAAATHSNRRTQQKPLANDRSWTWAPSRLQISPHRWGASSSLPLPEVLFSAHRRSDHQGNRSLQVQPLAAPWYGFGFLEIWFLCCSFRFCVSESDGDSIRFDSQNWLFVVRKSGISSLLGIGSTLTDPVRTGLPEPATGKPPAPTSRSAALRLWESRRRSCSTPGRLLVVSRPIGLCTSIASRMWIDPPPRRTTIWE